MAATSPTSAHERELAPARVGVVVVTYNAADHLAACLDALASTEWGQHSWRVFVVDNASGDGSVEIASRRPDVEVLAQRRNLGFAAGANVGMRAAIAWGADVIALVNDDAEVDRGWITPLVDALRADPSLGAVQPKLLVHGSDPPIVNSVGVWLDEEGSGRDIGYGERNGDEFARPRPIELFTGGAVLLRAAMLEDVGMFDPLLFMYYEDVDLGLRGRRRGWRYRSEPTSVVHHRVGASTSKVPGRRAHHQERNRLLIAARHSTALGYARAAWLALRRVRFQPRLAHATGLLAGIALTPRQLLLRLRDRRDGR